MSMPSTETVRRLSTSVSKSVAEAAAKMQPRCTPLDERSWAIESDSGKVYTVTLWEAAAGWFGECECTAFKIGAARAGDENPAPPCKHLVWVRSRFRPRSVGGGELATDQGEGVQPGLALSPAKTPATVQSPPAVEPVAGLSTAPAALQPQPVDLIEEGKPEPIQEARARAPAVPQPEHRPGVFPVLPLPTELVVARTAAILDVMARGMKKGHHYGKIPGCGPKPTLLKPGAEKLLLMFQLAPKLLISRTDLPGGHREYEVRCELTHAPSGTFLGHGIGSASSMEAKWRYRWQNTGKPVPGPYWGTRDPALLGGPDFSPRKVYERGKKPEWFIFQRHPHDNPADYFNTVIKMAKKRALVDAVLTVTAASDVFTQDIEERTEEETDAGD